MIVSHKHRFIFVHIHKTAGEAFADALAPHLGDADFQVGLDHSKDTDVLNGVTLNKHSTAAEIRQAVGDDVWARYHSFATVRRPAERALSLYRYIRNKFEEQGRIPLRRKLKQKLGMAPEPMRWKAMQAFIATTDFSHFIRHSKFLADDGAQPQIGSLTDTSGAVIVDRICRFETLTDEFASLAADLNLPGAALKKINQSGSEGLSTNWGAAISEDDAAYLADLYAEDMRVFNYKI